MSIVTRQGKGSRLTVEEMDGNFTYLEELASQAVLGVTGPAGATGPQGVTGPAGATGPQGPVGYKVYVALLSQTGGDNPSFVRTDNMIGDQTNIQVGVTYEIESGNEVDLIPYGAPNNDIGTLFMATSDFDFAGLNIFLRFNTGAPVVTLLENTLDGVPYWTRNSTGQYLCYLDGAFDKTKTFCSVTYGYDWGNLGNIYFGHSASPDYLYMYFYDYSGSNIDIQNGPSGNDIYVEVRVYN